MAEDIVELGDFRTLSPDIVIDVMVASKGRVSWSAPGIGTVQHMRYNPVRDAFEWLSLVIGPVSDDRDDAGSAEAAGATTIDDGGGHRRDGLTLGPTKKCYYLTTEQEMRRLIGRLDMVRLRPNIHEESAFTEVSRQPRRLPSDLLDN